MDFNYIRQILGLPPSTVMPQIIERPPVPMAPTNTTVIQKNQLDPVLDANRLPAPVPPPAYLTQGMNSMPAYPVPEVRPPVFTNMAAEPAIADVSPIEEPPPVLPTGEGRGLLDEPPAQIGSMDAGIPLNSDATKTGGINPFALGMSLLAEANKPAMMPPPPPASAYRPQINSVDNLMKLYKGALL